MAQPARKLDINYNDVFHSSVVPIWIEDVAPLYQKFSELKKSGVTNLRQYLEEYPNEVGILASRIEVLEVNEATVKMYGAKSSQDFVGNLHRLLGTMEPETFITALVAFWNQDEVLCMEATIQPLDRGPINVLTSIKIPRFDSKKLVLAITVTDITIQHQQQQALAAAIEEVKTLQGIVPICSSCKMIRDDDGYWSQIERYIANRTGAKFTHGICPDCTTRIYPDLQKKK